MNSLYSCPTVHLQLFSNSSSCTHRRRNPPGHPAMAGRPGVPGTTLVIDTYKVQAKFAVVCINGILHN